MSQQTQSIHHLSFMNYVAVDIKAIQCDMEFILL